MNDETDPRGPEDLGDNSAAQLAGFIQRIEILETERAQIREKIKAEYAMAEGTGFDKAAIKQVVKDRRADLEKTIAFRAVVEAYRKALARTLGDKLGELGEWARTWLTKEAKTERDDAKAGYARPLDEFLKNRAKGKPTGGEGAGDVA